MKELELYREDNGQYSTSEARQDDVSGAYVQKTDYDELRVDHYDERAKVQELLKENAELTIKLSSVIDSKSCATCNNTGSYDYDDGFGGVCSSSCHCTNNPYSTYSIINSTRIKSLADIKADAVDHFIESVLKSGANYVKGQSYKPFVYLDDARKYAKKLRGEEK